MRQAVRDDRTHALFGTLPLGGRDEPQVAGYHCRSGNDVRLPKGISTAEHGVVITAGTADDYSWIEGEVLLT